MKIKYCVIRKVPYRVPATNRIVWANVLSESYGLALILVPKSHTEGAHSIVVAQENLSERIFEAVGSSSFEIGSMEVKTVGDTLRILGWNFLVDELRQTLEEELGGL
jgi:hypothetical protein